MKKKICYAERINEISKKYTDEIDRYKFIQFSFKQTKRKNKENMLKNTELK